MDASQLTRKVVYGHQTMIQGLGHFSKGELSRAIPPIMFEWGLSN